MTRNFYRLRHNLPDDMPICQNTLKAQVPCDRQATLVMITTTTATGSTGGLRRRSKVVCEQCAENLKNP